MAPLIPQGLALLEFVGARTRSQTPLRLCACVLCAGTHLGATSGTHLCPSGDSRACVSLRAALASPTLLIPHPTSGLLVGKALYDGILLNMSIAPPLVMALQGARPGIDDLAGVDPALAAGLAAVRTYAGDAADLGLTFSVDTEAFGRVSHACPRILPPLRVNAPAQLALLGGGEGCGC